MTTSTQTQLRRGTSAQVAGMTPAAGEAVVNTTDKRVHVGDGATAGGMPNATAADVQKQAFLYPAVGGTGNAITLTNSPTVGSYAAPLKQVFKAGASNTTAVTVNVDGLGAKAVKKMNNGALAALVSGDIVSGGLYEMWYDGTQFQIKGLGEGPFSAGALAFLGAATASGSAAVDFTSLMSATYDDYVVLFDNVVATSAAADLLLRCSPDNSTFDAAASYAYAILSCNSAASTVTVVRSGSATAVVIASALPGSQGCSGRIDVFGANNSSLYRYVNADASHLTGSTLANNRTSGVWENATNALQAIRFLMSTSTIASGTFRLYGVAKS